MKTSLAILKRQGLYIMAMYPPLPSLLISICSFYNLYFLLAVLRGESKLEVTWASLAGAMTLFFFLLFLRISDELKDYESDKLLFPERLVPSGQVLLSDLYGLMGFSVVVMWGLNLFLTGAFIPFLLLFSFGLLMLKYFFYPEKISGSLFLALVTHNPSVLMMNIYVIAIFAAEYQQVVFDQYTFYLATLFWLPGLAWELSRKIKAPEDENEYETYSQIFGYKLSALIPMLVVALHYFMLVRLFVPAGLSVYLLLAVSLTMIVLLLFFGRFLMRPNAQTSRLKPITEIYMLVSAGGLFLDFVLRKEVIWTLLHF